MNALTVDPLARVVVELEAGDDDYGHIVCCRPNVALCGEDMTGARRSVMAISTMGDSVPLARPRKGPPDIPADRSR